MARGDAEDPLSKRGGRTATRRSSVSGERTRAHSEDEGDPVLLDALGLPPGRSDAAANIAMMGTAGDNEDGHWRADFEPEEHRRPRITKPSTPLEAGNEEVDFGVAPPQEERLRLSPIRDTTRARAGSAPPGFASRSALTALEVVDLMDERHRAGDKEKRLYARLPRLEETPRTYAEVQLFRTAIEEEAERAGLPDKRYELAVNQMSITLTTSYRRLAATKFPGLPPTYERVVEAMVESVAPGKPEGHLLKAIKTLAAGKMGVWPLREQLDRMYQTYFALCRRTRIVPMITEQIVVGICLRYLPEELGAKVRDLASDTELETLYTVAKLATARKDRRTTHPLLRDTRGLSLPGGDAAGLLLISGESAGSNDLVLAAREPRIPAATVDREVHRPGGGFYGEGSGPPASDCRREGFPDRPTRPLMMPPRAPPRPILHAILHALALRMFRGGTRDLRWRGTAPRRATSSCSAGLRHKGRGEADAGRVGRPSAYFM